MIPTYVRTLGGGRVGPLPTAVVAAAVAGPHGQLAVATLAWVEGREELMGRSIIYALVPDRERPEQAWGLVAPEEAGEVVWLPSPEHPVVFNPSPYTKSPYGDPFVTTSSASSALARAVTAEALVIGEPVAVWRHPQDGGRGPAPGSPRWRETLKVLVGRSERFSLPGVLEVRRFWDQFWDEGRDRDDELSDYVSEESKWRFLYVDPGRVED